MGIIDHRYLLIILLIMSLTGCATLRWERHVRLTCGTCHDGTPKNGSPSLKNKENPSETCRSCHKYRTDGDHHPSDPEAELVGDRCANVDPSFPLASGKMECLTCRQMHSEDIYYSGTKYFLRGGPYSDRREVCFKCHRQELYVGINPHVEMVEKNSDLNFSTCLVCHTTPPDPKVDTFKNVRFRASVAFLCWRCHPPMMAEFMDKHFLKIPRKQTFENMLKGEAEHKVILPLDSKGRVTCSTCHNPHQQGVMVKEWAKKGERAEKRLRDPSMCTICHRGKMPKG
jgi:hypothetical protein